MHTHLLLHPTTAAATRAPHVEAALRGPARPVRAAGNPQRQWEEEEEVLIDEDIGADVPAQLIVYNDDFNTFEWVIQCFVEVLNHTLEQSEQLALIIHFKGKATVKSGSKAELMPLREGLIDRGLSAVIEEVK
jgi:ATP-dependent Clp protease adaptor protein ClpS